MSNTKAENKRLTNAIVDKAMAKVRNRSALETTEPDLITEVEESPTYHQLFEPCAVDEHSDCIGYSNGLRRDAALVVCSCECHAAERR